MIKKMLTSLILLLIVATQAYANYDGEMTIHKIFGDVIIQTEFDGNINIDTGRYPLFNQDRIITGNGRAEVYAITGCQIKVNEQSNLKIIDNKNTILWLESGSFHVNCKKLFQGQLQIEFPYGNLLCDSNSNFFISIEGLSKIKIGVYDGGLTLKRDLTSTNLQKGDSIIIDRGNLTWLKGVYHSNDNNYNEIIVNYEGTYDSYLPPQLSVYAFELRRHGRWVYVADYGYCWLPLSISRGGWSPYQCGRWLTRGGRQIWIACEPWGWVPHHYGRWVNIEFYGWLWVPPHRNHLRWEPAHVVWFESPRGKAWIPLAPNEFYRGKPIRIDNFITINNRTYITINNPETKLQYRNLSFYSKHERPHISNIDANRFPNNHRFFNNQNNFQQNENPHNRNNHERLTNENNHYERNNNPNRIINPRKNDDRPISIHQRRLPISGMNREYK